jgi:hypothetical protein
MISWLSKMCLLVCDKCVEAQCTLETSKKIDVTMKILSKGKEHGLVV